MVTTVTSSTIAAVAAALPASLFLVFVLFVLLVMKELMGASDSPLARVLSRTLTAMMYPLLVAFIMLLLLHVLIFETYT